MVHASRVPKELLLLLQQQVDAIRARETESSSSAAPDATHLSGADVPEGDETEKLSVESELDTDAHTQPVPGRRTWSSKQTESAPAAGGGTSTRSKRGKAEAPSKYPDLTKVLAAGDVVRVRVFGMDEEKQRLDLTMLPHRLGERDAQVRTWTLRNDSLMLYRVTVRCALRLRVMIVPAAGAVTVKATGRKQACGDSRSSPLRITTRR
jgi:hypothetical protein